jgi:hypothetical protein
MLSEKSSTDEIYEVIGKLLITTQGVERLINHSLGFVLRFLQAATIDEIYALNEPEKKKTLGALLRELRERVSVEASFDCLLKSFLANRNTFAHTMSFLPGWTLETEAGRRVAMQFLERYTGEIVRFDCISAPDQSSDVGNSEASPFSAVDTWDPAAKERARKAVLARWQRVKANRKTGEVGQ